MSNFTENPVSQITTFGVGSTSSSGSNDLAGLNDGTDKLHSGILKVLFAASTGNYVYSLGSSGIKQSAGTTYTRLTLDNDIKFYRNNQSYKITGTDMTVDLSAAADSTTDRYDLLVIKSFTDATCDLTDDDATVTHDANANIVAGLAVYGLGVPKGATIASITDSTHFELSAIATQSLTNTTLTFSSLAVRNGTVTGTDSNVAALSANDVPIALIKVVAGTGNNITTRPLQLFTAVEEDRFLYNTGDQSGRVGVGTNDPQSMLHIKSGRTEKPRILLENTNDDNQETIFTFKKTPADGSAANSDDLGIIRFEGKNDNNDNYLFAYMATDARYVADGEEAGRMQFYVSHKGDGDAASTKRLLLLQGNTGNTSNGSVHINDGNKNVDFIVDGDSVDNLIRTDGSADKVAIGTSTVDTNCLLTVEGAISLDEISAPTNTADRGQLYTNADNELHMIDGAGTDAIFLKSGLHTIWIPASAIYPNTTAGCSALTQVELSNGPELKCLDFDDGATESAQFTVAFPKSWNEGVVKFKAYWCSTATDTDGVSWGLSACGMNDNETINLAFGTQIVVDDANQGAANELMVSPLSAEVTIAGTPAAEDLTFFQISRVHDDSNDTAAEDARLLGIKLYYTIDAGNDV